MEIMFALLIAGMFAASAIKNFGPVRQQAQVLDEYGKTAISAMNGEVPKQICGVKSTRGVYKIERPDQAGIELGLQALLSAPVMRVVVKQGDATYRIEPGNPETEVLECLSYDKPIEIRPEYV